MPAFVYFFRVLYPFPWVNDPRRSTAAAAGGVMLVRRSALDRIGRPALIRSRLIDDCALAAALKRAGIIVSAWTLPTTHACYAGTESAAGSGASRHRFVRCQRRV